MVSFVAATFAFLRGHASPRLRYGQTCELAGYPMDEASIQSTAYSRTFPITYPCTEDFNLVPWWVNPLVVLATVACIVSVILFLWTMVKLTQRKVQG